jgi:hypothetical protein
VSNNVVDDGGVFIATWAKPPVVGSIAELALSEPSGRRVVIRGSVAFIKDDLGPDSPAGYGVRFLRLHDEAREFVEDFLKSREPLIY